MPQRNPDPRPVLRSVAWFLVPFGLAFLAPGLWLLNSYLRIQREWPEVEAAGNGGTIATYTQKRRTYYRPRIELTYQAGGRTYTTPVPRPSSSRDRDKIQRQLERFGPGSRHRIRWNPANPHDIRLDTASWTFWLLPGLFTGIGLLLLAIGLWALWRSRSPYRGLACPSCQAPILERYSYCLSCSTRVAPRDEAPSDGHEEEAELANAIKSRKGERISGAVFVVLGLAMLTGGALLARTPLAARRWPVAEAGILQSQFVREPGSRGIDRYKVRVQLQFTVGGRSWSPWTTLGASDSYAWVRQQADQWQPGVRKAVRYDPANPDSVYPEQNWRFEVLIIPAVLAALGLSFAGVGAAVIWRAARFRQIRCPACRLPAAPHHRWCTRCGVPLVIPFGTSGPLPLS